MKKQILIHYRTAEGSYESLRRELDDALLSQEIIPWALKNLPSGSFIVASHCETRPEYPEETVLRKFAA